MNKNIQSAIIRSLVMVLFINTIGPLTAMAQDEEEINVAGIRFLDFGASVPEDILSTKAVVLLQVPPVNKQSSIRGDWKPMATKAHAVFTEIGVDAVGYYYMEDVMAGREVTEAFAKSLKDREVSYIIILSNVWIEIKGKESERFVMLITPFSGDERIMANGQPAWKTQSKDLDKTIDKLSKEVSRRRLDRQNRLIAEQPELFRDFDIIKGRRAETYTNSLDVDKVAFAGFEEAEIPDDRPGGIINNNIAREAEKSNMGVVRQNQQMKAILSAYPYEFQVVEARPNEQELMNQGFQYVVYVLNTTAMSIRYVLDYEIEDDVSDFITVKQNGGSTILRNIPIEAPVYKFYIKHLRTSDVYVGSKWDADETWEEALQNFISNIKRDFE